MAKILIKVFEHSCLKVGDGGFEEKHLHALQKHHGIRGCPFYSLINNGVKFCEFVGVISVGSLTIEVLPKIDNNEYDKDNWHRILIGMLKKVGIFKVSSTSHSDLKLKANSILDLYFEIFINEAEYLLHTGLIRKYRKTEENLNTLKGRLNFTKQISKNLIHKEKFHVTHTVYDNEHVFNKLILKTLRIIKRINTNVNLIGRINSLLLFYPELEDVKVSESTFIRLKFDRKSERYKTIIEVCKLLLLNYHPDISKGNDYVLALMFDMNLLWERFIYESLRKNGIKVSYQNSVEFWKLKGGLKVNIRPDLVIENENRKYIIDTKWKILKDSRPSDDDLKQMFAYSHYYESAHTVLCYPGISQTINSGSFSLNYEYNKCSTLEIPVKHDINEWMKEIEKMFEEKILA